LRSLSFSRLINFFLRSLEFSQAARREQQRRGSRDQENIFIPQREKEESEAEENNAKCLIKAL
jgi:hypothetical protein